jgi:hypothetical protein
MDLAAEPRLVWNLVHHGEGERKVCFRSNARRVRGALVPVDWGTAGTGSGLNWRRILLPTRERYPCAAEGDH